MGRALLILGIVQIPLGMTLYGSPKVLFILFALASFAYLVAFFVLSYLYDDEGFHVPSEHGSRYEGPSEVSHHAGGGGGGGMGQALAGGALGAALGSMFKRRGRSRHSSHAYEDSRTSGSSEKYSDESSRKGGFGKKLFEIGALAGAGLLAKKWWDGRKKREDDTEAGRYRPAESRSDSYSDESLSRLEDGRPEPSHRINRPPSRPPSRSQSPGSSYYYNSTYFTEPPARRPSNGIKDAILGAGAFAGLKKMFGGRKNKDDQEKRRLEEIRRQEDEDERLQRMNSKRRHNDGPSPRPGPYPQRRNPSAYSDTELTPTDLTPRQPRHPSHASLLSAEPMATGAIHDVSHSDIPPRPPVHHELSGADSRSELPESNDGTEIPPAVASGAALGTAARPRRNSRSQSRHRDDHTESPPVSVKVKMHNDGRHVTLRRLTEEEAAAQRDARRRERRNSRRRAGSASSVSGDERSQDRWRRVEEMERQQAEQTRREQEAAAGRSGSFAPSAPVSSFPPPSQSNINLPPPPVPHPPPSTMPFNSVTSPPDTWTGTEASGSYANNRRRRRAERARARQDRQQQHGVEFE